MKLPVFRQLVSTVRYLCVRASDPSGRDRAQVLAQLSMATARLQGADCPQKGPDDGRSSGGPAMIRLACLALVLCAALVPWLPIVALVVLL